MIHENYEDFIAGDATQTNWPTFEPTPRRKDKEKYFVDVDGETAGQGKTLDLARQLADLLGGTVRRHVIVEETLAQENSDRRERMAFGDFTHG